MCSSIVSRRGHCECCVRWTRKKCASPKLASRFLILSATRVCRAAAEMHSRMQLAEHRRQHPPPRPLLSLTCTTTAAAALGPTARSWNAPEIPPKVIAKVAKETAPLTPCVFVTRPKKWIVHGDVFAPCGCGHFFILYLRPSAPIGTLIPVAQLCGKAPVNESKFPACIKFYF